MEFDPMRRQVATAFVILAAAPATAETVRAPKLAPGDSWTYENSNETTGGRRVTHDVATLVRADRQWITVEIHAVGSANPGPERLFGPDWSRVRSVNGRQTVVNQPLAYPLAPGKSWTTAYSEDTPANRNHTREQWRMTYKVTGWTDITVTAGTFRALKIEGDGTWTAELPSNVLVAKGRLPNGADVAVTTRQTARVASGRFIKAFWYVPEVHRWVKSEEDIYDSNGMRTEHVTAELEAFTLADPAGAATTDTPETDAAPSPPKHVGVHKPARAPASAAAPAKPALKPPHPAAPALPPLQETQSRPAFDTPAG